ncbi:MAG: hypothetical protein JRJ15_15975 [Deltaproteobacteria bacterium]|nr:hypothetical protein [Deltaproteobacteria bacterium]
MNFLVVGPGAMGCLFASRLKKAGHEVMLADHRPERADFINKNGLLMEGADGEERVPVPVIREGSCSGYNWKSTGRS